MSEDECVRIRARTNERAHLMLVQNYLRRRNTAAYDARAPIVNRNWTGFVLSFNK